MSDLITYLWQASFCLLVFFLGYTLWLKRESSFEYRRIYLLAGSILSLALPLLRFPSLSSTYVQGLDLPVLELTAVNVAAGTDGFPIAKLVLIIYTCIAIGLAAVMIFKIWSTLRLIRGFRKSEFTHNGQSVYLTEGQLPSSSFFMCLLFDNSLTTDNHQRQLILDHELVHIKQGHSFDIMFLEVQKVIFWFNPVVWWMPNEMRLVHEYIADDQVVSKHSRQHYLKILSQHTLTQFKIPWVQQFNFNGKSTLNRIKMIESKKSPIRFWKYGILAGIYVLLHVFIACTDEQPIADNDMEEVFNFVDERPFPINGMDGLYQEIATVLKYPKEARLKGIEGKVYVSFVESKQGELTDIKLLKGIGHGCDEAALEALKKVKPWSPGIHEGKPVRVLMQMPVVFKLDDN